MRATVDDPAACRRRGVAERRRRGGDRARTDSFRLMLERIDSLREEAAAAIAAAPDAAALEELRVRYLGRKSELTAILRGISELEASERGPVGAGANAA